MALVTDRGRQEGAGLHLSLSVSEGVTHLFLPTDVTDGGDGGGAGGRANDRDHALRQDLTHCERRNQKQVFRTLGWSSRDLSLFLLVT